MLTVVPPWLPAAGEVLSVGLTSVLPAGGELDVADEEADEEADEWGVTGLELTDAGGGVETLGLAVLAGAALAWQDGGAVAWLAFLLPVAPVLAAADAESVALAVLVALLLAVPVEVVVPVPVPVPVAVPVAEVLPLSPGLTLVAPLLPRLSLEAPPDGTVPERVGGTLGSALLDLAVVAEPAGEVGGQAVARALAWLADELTEPAPPFAEPGALPAPFRLGAPLLGLEEENPTAEPSETTASRSGGRARTTPMANTAQAAARAGLSSPSRQSRGRSPPRPLPPRAGAWPPRPAFQRPARAARKPPDAAARLLTWAGPDRTRARMRSRPSGCGST